MSNSNLSAAKKAKNDEFYTQFSDIEKELSHYKQHFVGKTIFCNCDDPTWSNFWRYFHLNFAFFGLKKLIATHYDANQSTYKMEYEGGDDTNLEAGVMTPLQQNGDFRSPECVELLKEADIVATNPMFSLFREYVSLLIEQNKKFIIMGNMNAVTYKEFFPLLKENKVWAGYSFNKSMLFAVPEGYDVSKNVGEDEFGRKLVKVPAICWYTNLDIVKRHEPIDLVEEYTPEKYQKYDNYDAINVDKTLDIPCDYEPCWHKCPHASTCQYAQTEGKEDNALCEQACNGEIGVPISFLDKYSPDQFEILGTNNDFAQDQPLRNGKVGTGRFYLSDSSQSVQVERESRDVCTAELLFVGCRKCNGIMGVPISFLDKHCPEQFEIVGLDRYVADNPRHGHRFTLNNKETYARVLVRKV